jgi:rubrerythrin
MSDPKYQAELARKRAAQTFQHYMKIAMSRDTAKVTGEMMVEWDGIIDDVIEAATMRALGIWIDKAREFQKFLIECGCSCAAEKLVDEWLEEGIKPPSQKAAPRPPAVIDLSKLQCRDCGHCMDVVAPDKWHCPECGLELTLKSNHPGC